MSLVSFGSLAEQEAAVRRQRRNSTLLSIGISVLVIGALMLILGIFVLPALVKETPVVVAYSAPLKQEEVSETKKVTKVQSKPAAPSSAQAQVITANTASPTAVPVPEVNVSEVSLEFGSGADFGAGWEMATEDAGAGSTSFFNQRVAAQRVVYVIDYSASMNAKGRAALMREEMVRSIKELKPGMQFQMIFFSAPAWIGGSEIEIDLKNKGEATIKFDGDEFKWKGKPNSYKGWKPVGDVQKPEWISFDSSARRKAIEAVEETGLELGTDWVPPLQMALSMDPPPQVIFFMTDGVGGSVQDAEELAKEAKRKRTIVNTISLMEPGAVDGMKALAKGSGGQFTIVNEDGKAEVQSLD